MKENTTLRMSRCGADRTLHGYIFSDRKHAHDWMARFSDRSGFRFEEVEVGPIMPCPRCNGSGHRQDVKVVRRLTHEDVANV